MEIRSGVDSGLAGGAFKVRSWRQADLFLRSPALRFGAPHPFRK